jgi:folate-binding protein YgfZ
MDPTWPAEYSAARNGAALFDRSGAGIVELAGPDACQFLHNLCTQDVKALAPNEGAEAFLTTAKARVVAHGAVSHVSWTPGESRLWLDVEPGHSGRVVQHLNHFLISEQVEIADRTPEFAMLRLVGPAAPALLGPIFPSTSLSQMKPWNLSTDFLDGKQVVIRHHVSLNLPAYDCFCERAPELAQRLIAAGAVAAGDVTHDLLRIEAGWPRYGIDMDDNRFVVEVGRAAQAICYTKGCYLGQEPIVMARDRGQVNRMLQGVHCGAGPALAAGTKLFQGDTEVGQVTSSVVSPRLGQAIALAYLRRGSQEPGTPLRIEGAAGRTATVCALPFAT